MNELDIFQQPVNFFYCSITFIIGFLTSHIESQSGLRMECPAFDCGKELKFKDFFSIYRQKKIFYLQGHAGGGEGGEGGG